MAGHSKWANIKHRKGRQDAIRGKLFTRIAKEITISAREGGGDPDMNPRLRLAVANAKTKNMPNENIIRAIKKGTGEIEGVTYEENTYEGYAPNGVAVILETVTDNKNRTVSEVRALFNKYGGNLGETNSVAWNFERSGVIEVKTGGKSEEELLEYVLEAGADDMEYNGDTARVICPKDDFAEVNKFFENSDLEIAEAQLEYIPKDKIVIDDVAVAQKIIRFLEVFEEHDDVQNLFSNFEIADSIADKLGD